MKRIIVAMVLTGLLALTGCETAPETSDTQQARQQEQAAAEINAKTGMPSVTNGREKKLLKAIYELRDQEGLVTYTYIVAAMTGKLVFLGNTIGYGIPAATQYTNPQKIEEKAHQTGYAILPQADPNGLFSPASAEGTWVMMKDPNSDKLRPVYIEERIIVSPFKLN